ncbi:U-box domain-containing protein 19-like [Coffea arabica]|uniref:RING-type E3 ubiquitin transferase n=1 Tax=Coffea arabica TaxID=13443 RepID=A0A6P6XHR9_COFAR|nr:U-box domain-containing protein 19-like [Coffea arabica]
MIQRFDRSDRRILTFPAVHPCEGISPGILLESLINLSGRICSFRSKYIPSQRKNAREVIRQIGILLMFFEEIREHVPSLSSSFVLCFSELHLTFQKIEFLLEDCTREGARLWILTKSHFITTQFRVLVRAMATALDVLPLKSIDLSREVKELVELVAKQSQKAKVEIGIEDEEELKRVIVISNQFENRFEPERCVIKKVLDFLDIRSWNDCQKEIKFLEEEIRLELNDGNVRELPLLSSLVGLLCYSRGVLYEDYDYGNSDQSDDGRHSLETLTCLNPEDFRCPISLELMTDPVTVSTGQTYDRISIQKWLGSGHLICPKTGEKLTSTELVPNSALLKLIQQFCADNGISLAKSRKKNRDVSRTIVPGSAAAAEAIRFLAHFLACRLCFGTVDQKNKAAYEIRLLAKSNIFNRSCMIEAGTVPPLLGLLNSKNPSMQENAMSALLKLSKHSSGTKEIMENWGLKLILRVLRNGLKMEARQTAAATLFYLASVHEYRKLIGETPDAIPALVELIKDGATCGKKNAVVAIFGLLLSHRNHQRVIAAGTIPALVNLLAISEKVELTTDALAVLATLADSVNGSSKILESSALPTVLGLLHSTTSRAGKEYCLSILHSLCLNCGADVISVLAKDQSLMPALYSLVTEGTSLAGKKARSLIKILHKFGETSSSGSIRQVLPGQFVHVR